MRGRREVSADTALRLARYFGTSAHFWLNAQMGYDLSKAEGESARQIASEIRPRAA